MKKTIVTSVYELKYEPERSGEVYKNFALLAETLNNLIFDDFEYIIYSNQETIKKHYLHDVYKTSERPNVKIIEKELNGEFYSNNLNPLREKQFKEAKGEMYDRIYSVKNYIEVIFNKLQNVLELSKIESESDKNDAVVWLDAGLFGTSCSNAWRDYMRRIIYGNKTFLDKIFEKIEQNDFIATKGNTIVINYELRDRIYKTSGVDLRLVPGCLFGGKKYKNIELLNNYKEVLLKHVQEHNELISEQEVLSIVLDNKNVKFFEFFDWVDLQRAMLKIMDLYDESIYETEKCYDV